MEGRLLLSLPTILAADILQRWLDVRASVKLDTAYCKTSVRQDFLDLIGSPEFSISTWVLDPSGFIKATNNVVGWANIRNVAVKNIHLNMDSDLKVYAAFLKKRAGSVHVIKASEVTFAVNMMKAIATCTNLTMLNLYDCEIPSSLREVFIECKYLRECTFINLSGRKWRAGGKKPKKTALKDTDLEGLSCPNIKAIRIEISEDFHLVAALLKLSLKADTVYLSSIRTDYIDALFAYMNPGLTTLCLPEAYLSSKGLHALIECFPDLTHLDLDSVQLTDLMVEEIGHSLSLKSLNLSFAPMGDEVLEPLAKSCGDKLTELLLCDSDKLSLEAVQEVLPRFTKLTSFGMYYSDEDAGVMDLALLGRFTSLTLLYEGEDGAEFVADLARHCPKLEHLHIQLFDQYFLAEDMDHLVNTCVNLRTLTLAGEFLPFHGADDVARWRVLRPHLVVSSTYVVELSVLRDQFLF